MLLHKLKLNLLDYETSKRSNECIKIVLLNMIFRMYQEKMSELNEEAIMIANGTHPELVSLMTEIEEKKGNRIQSAESWRRYQHDNFKKQFEGFEYQANIHFIVRNNCYFSE